VSAPLVVSIPHRLGKQEAIRRLTDGLRGSSQKFGHLLLVDEQAWQGDRLTFRIRALGQAVGPTIDVFEDRLLLEVTLPWLLAKLAERVVPVIRKEAVLLLEKK